MSYYRWKKDRNSYNFCCRDWFCSLRCQIDSTEDRVRTQIWIHALSMFINGISDAAVRHVSSQDTQPTRRHILICKPPLQRRLIPDFIIPFKMQYVRYRRNTMTPSKNILEKPLTPITDIHLFDQLDLVRNMCVLKYLKRGSVL